MDPKLGWKDGIISVIFRNMVRLQEG
jgi:dynein heavy chain